LSIDHLACTTIRRKDNGKFDRDKLNPDLTAALYRAALKDESPPITLLKPILDRFKSNLAKNGLKALYDQSRFALLKLTLNRQLRKEGKPEMHPQVFETDDLAYNCGRLLAVLAEAQQKAHEYKLEGAGIAERYFGTACSSPASVFPLLMRLNRHHLNKIRKSDRYKGHERFLEGAIQQILALFKPESCNQPPKFPRVLDLQAQGRFALGFYQQQAADDAARHAAKSGNSQP
jgi:CRISPR-associated protein Csd1